MVQNTKKQQLFFGTLELTKMWKVGDEGAKGSTRTWLSKGCKNMEKKEDEEEEEEHDQKEGEILEKNCEPQPRYNKVNPQPFSKKKLHESPTSSQ